VRAVRETNGAYLTVSDEEILAAMRDLARGVAVFAEPAGATAYAGVVKAAREGLVRSDETTVCVITGNGLKDIASAMKAAGEARKIEPGLEEVQRMMNLDILSTSLNGGLPWPRAHSRIDPSVLGRMARG
jgi:threonine synthase